MAVVVTRHEDTVEYPEATGWHVDEERQLHVRGASGNVAVYAVNEWVSAHEVAKTGSNQT